MIKTRKPKKAPDQFYPNTALCKEVYTVQGCENIQRPNAPQTGGLDFIVASQEETPRPTDTDPTPILLNSFTLQNVVAALKVSV